ncbi:MAG: S41 family peptidase [Candidatus Omnitrophica bacterium]|nr:S41 family peptidase [Candidatus Omnitrophota bacterium]
MSEVWERVRRSIIPVAVALVLGVALGGGVKLSAKSDAEDDFYKEIPLFTDVVSVIQSDYVEEVTTKDLIYGALKGMLSSLDPHSQFMDPDTYKEMQIETKGEFGGLGIVITIRDQFLTVVTPLEDTPAYRSGLKSGDRIVKIDDKPTKDMSLFDAVKMMRGKPGSEIVLTVMREDVNTLMEFRVTRDIIEINSIKEAKMLDAHTGYIKIVEFQEKTARDLEAALERLKKEGMQALILDLRNNPGGLLNSAVDVGEFFIPRGKVIVSTRGRLESQAMEFKAQGKKDLYGDIPLVVLVNEGSASASEIVAGAIRDHHRGILLGVKTFGKGSVQTVSPLRDGSAVRLTTAKYYTPAGQSIHEVGVEPDVVVKLTDEEEVKIAEREVKVVGEPDANPDSGEAKPPALDGQLARALDLIKGIEVWRNIQGDHTGD